MNESIYQNGQYIENNPKWHQEDSPWKAQNILKIIKKNNLSPLRICEVGCGAGEVLNQLYLNLPDQTIFDGYEISQQAYDIARTKQTERLNYYIEDIFKQDDKNYDLLLAIDVIEHIENYFQFVRDCGKKAEYKIYHIPLEMHASAILRSRFDHARSSVGHIHYFCAQTALSVLEDCGQQIIDYFYTDLSQASPKYNSTLKKRMANLTRLFLSSINLPITVKLFGGYSLLVLTK